jgi:hypothetical protein
MAITTVLLSDTIDQFKTKTNTISADVGDFSALTTPITSDLVSIVNSLDSDLEALGNVVSGVDALTLEGQAGAFYLDYDNFTNIPATFDSDLSLKSTTDLTEGTNLYYTVARANSAIDARVNKSFVDALNVDADTLDTLNSTYLLDYNNFTNTPDISAIIIADVDKVFVDGLNVNADTLDGNHGTYFLNYSNFTNTPTPYSHPNHSGEVTSTGDGATVIANDVVTNAKLANMTQTTIKGRASGAGTGDPTDLSAAQVRTILNVENGATADQSNAEIETAYNAQVSTVGQAEAEAGTATTVRRWTAQRVGQAVESLSPKYLATDPTVRSSAFTAVVNTRYHCSGIYCCCKY